ncbi:hypothetical protein DPMN_184992 [Dreissena polymorpha]|uniref:Uncharacterized protein n=1 Tax=Dreissena polymorpha TaxID=45954 RepID=A0A9D4DMT7_DREPO|nr:hypothetical protein DPMN_184992 [Dreissena polymorpha]
MICVDAFKLYMKDALNQFSYDYNYRFICRGLFERHKLLFSFQMCAKILEHAGKLNMDEYNFFLRGGVVSTRVVQLGRTRQLSLALQKLLGGVLKLKSNKWIELVNRVW